MNKKMTTKKISTLVPGTVYYARVHTPHDSGFNEGKYTLAIKVEDAVLKAIKKAAIDFGKEALGKEPTLTFIKDLQKLGIKEVIQAKTKHKPTILGELDQDLEDMIGNGSKVSVSLSLAAYDSFGKAGVTVYFDKLMVNELVAYEGEDTDSIKLNFEVSDEVDF